MNFYRDGDFKLSFRIKNNQPDSNPLKIASNGRLEVLNGAIAEIIVYGQTLSDTELNKVHTYLEQKYKIKLREDDTGINNWWLYILLLVAIIYLAVLITKYYSQKKLKRELAIQEEMNKERQRISREMHDDIGAGLTQITMMSEWAKNKLNTGNTKELDEIAETSRRLVSSMSEIVWSLNTNNKSLNQLTAYLRELLYQQLEYSEKTFTIQMPENGKDIILSNEQRRNILLVTKEIVNNAIKHSGATNISVLMEIQHGLLSCEITDDGIGFDSEKKVAGNGLKNIQHRINVIGGKLQVTSVQQKGSRFYYSVQL